MKRLKTLVATTEDCDATQLVELYDDTVTRILDKHAQVTTKTVIFRIEYSWYNDDIQRAKQERQCAERKWRKSKLCIDRDIYQAKE